MLRLLIGGALGLAALVVAAVPAFAHAHLVSATPAADASVKVGPAVLKLHFTERVEANFTGVTLEDATGQTIPTGPTSLDAADQTTIEVPVSATLGPGRYELAWHALAVDGHKTSGSYGFVVAP